MKLTLIRVGIILFLLLAVVQGIMAGRDVGRQVAAPAPAAPHPAS